MNTLEVDNLCFFRNARHGDKRARAVRKVDGLLREASEQLNFGSIGNLESISYLFSFGKVYLLDSEPDGGGWTLSWIIGGVLEQSCGTIKKNGIIYSLEERKRDSCCVRQNNGKRFLFWEQTVRDQIRQGLKTVQGQYLRSEDEIIRRFHLSPERYHRPLRCLSGEGWRASCAIGVANGKSVFCFPYMPSAYLQNYVRLEETIDVLKEAGALVLLPTKAIENTKDLCDEVVSVS